MATSQFPVPSAMDMKGDLPQNWAFFKNQWENYCIATKLTEADEKIRVATLLSVIGKDCFKLSRNLDMTPEDRKKEEKIIEALEKYFEPTRNVIYERYLFNTADQLQNENIDDYVTRLRQLSKSCDFGTLTDDLIRDRIVLGTKDPNLRARLLREPKLNLRGAIDKARSTEVAEAQLSQMSHPPEALNYAKQERKPKGSKKPPYNQNSRSTKDKPMINKCKYCGDSHLKGRDNCPAYGRTCSTCHKRNHYAKVCQSGEASTVHQMEDKHSYGDASSESSDESVYKVEHTVGAVRSQGTKWFANLALRSKEMVRDSNVKCQLDSGSTCNVRHRL